jgi:hypothetical protein
MEPAEDISNIDIRKWVMTALADQLNAKDSL